MAMGYRFIGAMFGLVIALSMAGCGWLGDKPIAIAAHVWPGYEPMFLARSEGWLDAKQVNLVETTSASGSLQALVERKVDGAALTLDEVLKARSMGIPLSVVAILDISAGADMLVVRPDIKLLPDLKGQRIGYESGALGALMLTEILRAAGLTKQDVRLVSLPIDKQRDAWERGEVDAVITYEPVASQLLKQGAIKLFDSRQTPNTIVDVLAIRNDVLDSSHAVAVRHLLSAHFRALEHLSREPHDAASHMTQRMKLPESEVLRSFKGLSLPNAGNNRRMLTGSPPPLLGTAGSISLLMVGEGLLPGDDSLTALIRADFLPSDAR